MNNLSMDLYLATDSDNNDNNDVKSIVMNELKGNGLTAHQFPHVSVLNNNKYDITIANILAPILIYLAEDLYKFTKLGGRIALSGNIMKYFH